MANLTEIALDIATYEGKTWLARVNGRDASKPGGIDRSFINAYEKNTSRSGATGTAMYEVESGVYESNEGRKRYGRRFWIVENGEAREVSRDEALSYLEAPSA